MKKHILYILSILISLSCIKASNSAAGEDPGPVSITGKVRFCIEANDPVLTHDGRLNLTRLTAFVAPEEHATLAKQAKWKIYGGPMARFVRSTTEAEDLLGRAIGESNVVLADYNARETRPLVLANGKTVNASLPTFIHIPFTEDRHLDVVAIKSLHEDERERMMNGLCELVRLTFDAARNTATFQDALWAMRTGEEEEYTAVDVFAAARAMPLVGEFCEAFPLPTALRTGGVFREKSRSDHLKHDLTAPRYREGFEAAYGPTLTKWVIERRIDAGVEEAAATA